MTAVIDEARPQALDLVLEDELALLEALQLQLVLPGVGVEPVDHIVEVMMLDLEAMKAAADLRLLLFGQGEVGHLWKRSCPVGHPNPILRGGKGEPAADASS